VRFACSSRPADPISFYTAEHRQRTQLRELASTRPQRTAHRLIVVFWNAQIEFSDVSFALSVLPLNARRNSLCAAASDWKPFDLFDYTASIRRYVSGFNVEVVKLHYRPTVVFTFFSVECRERDFIRWWMKVGYKDISLFREEITLVRDPEHVRECRRRIAKSGSTTPSSHTPNRRVEHRSRAEVELSRWRWQIDNKVCVREFLPLSSCPPAARSLQHPSCVSTSPASTANVECV